MKISMKMDAVLTSVLMVGCLMAFTVSGLEDCDSKKLTYIWEVSLDNFDHVTYLYSPPFSSWNGSIEDRWQLQFYPHGKASVSKDCLTVFLVHRQLRKIEIGYQIFLINQKDENATVSVDKESTFVNSEDGWGPGPCIEDENLNSPPSTGIYDPEMGFVVDGKIKIGVRIQTDPIPITREEPTTISYTWEIGLDSLKIDNGLHALSPEFRTLINGQEHTWQLQIYPNGVTTDTDGFLSIFLVHRGKGTITIPFEISLLNENPENSFRYAMEDTFTYDLHGWGEREVIERKALTEESGFVFENNIRISVRLPMDSLTFDNLNEGQTEVPFLWEVPLSEMSAKTGEYMLSPKFKTWNNGESETWQLQLFPRGSNSKHKEFLGIYLVHRGAKKVDNSFELHVANKNKEKNEVVRMENVKFKYDLHGWGSNTMMKRSILEDPERGFLFDGNVKIGVRLSTEHIALKETESLMVPYSWEVKVEDLKLGTGKYLLSPNITTWKGRARETWQIQLYPNGLSPNDNDHFALFVAHRGEHEVKSKWSVSIVNKEAWKSETRSGSNLFAYDLQGWGSRTFIEKAKVKDPSEGFIFGDRIKISVELPSDNITLSIDNDCPVIKEAPVCEVCPKIPPNNSPSPIQALETPVPSGARPTPAPSGARPTSAPINGSIHNLYREFKLKTPDGTEFSINHIMSFESIEKLMSNLIKLNSNSSNYNPPASGR